MEKHDQRQRWDMADSTLWWVLAGMAVVAELLTGTFYLLMLALGLAGGAVAAHLGLPPAQQLVCAAVLGAGAVAVLQKVRPRPHRDVQPQADADMNMDIGQSLQVDLWTGRTAQASYRGAQWSVELIDGYDTTAAQPGSFRICEVVGNVLRVEPPKT
jgi:membrane protein implicated in regulation of membrane protease activity